MPCRLLVVLGAGASFDCASKEVPRDSDYRPPLVTELFNPRREFARILHRYPLAEQAAAGIRTALSSGSVAIEAFLRDELRDSEHAHERRLYWAVPLYLQDPLFEIGNWDPPGRYTSQPDSYDRLVKAAMRADQATFVTLNYDVLLDQRLFMHLRGGLKSMDSYLASNKHWSLIKLHGSVNWGREVRGVSRPSGSDQFLAKTFGDLGDEIDLSDVIELRQHRTIQEMRFNRGEIPQRLLSSPVSSPRAKRERRDRLPSFACEVPQRDHRRPQPTRRSRDRLQRARPGRPRAPGVG